MVVGLAPAFAIPREKNQLLNACQINIDWQRVIARAHHRTHEKLLAVSFDSKNHRGILFVCGIIHADLGSKAFRCSMAVNQQAELCVTAKSVGEDLATEQNRFAACRKIGARWPTAGVRSQREIEAGHSDLASLQSGYGQKQEGEESESDDFHGMGMSENGRSQHGQCVRWACRTEFRASNDRRRLSNGPSHSGRAYPNVVEHRLRGRQKTPCSGRSGLELREAFADPLRLGCADSRVDAPRP